MLHRITILALITLGFWLGCEIGCYASERLIHVQARDELVMNDGTKYVGNIVDENNESYEIRLLNGSKTPVQKSRIRSVRRRQSLQDALEKLFRESKGDPLRLVAVVKEYTQEGYRGADDKILEMLNSVVESGNTTVLEELTEWYLRVRKIPEAVSTAQKLISKKDAATSYVLLGKALFDQGQQAAAEEAFHKAAQMEPDNQQVMIERARFLLASGRPKDASQIFLDALSRNPRLTVAHIGLGNVNLRQGNLTDAMLSFEQALKLEDKNLEAKVGLATCRTLRKEYDEAYALADEVLRYDPKHARAFGVQAYALLMTGDTSKLDKALQRTEDSIGEFASDPRIWLIRAVALDRSARVLELDAKAVEAKQRREEAIKLLLDVAKIDPPDPVLQYLLGHMRFKQNSSSAYEQALECFKRAAKLASTYAPAHQAVGATALRLRKWNEAEQAYAKASELDPNTAEYHGGRGLALLGMKRLNDAKIAFKQARDIDPNNVSALCGLGYLANYDHNEDGAKAFFAQALASDGKCEFAAQALNALYRQRGLIFDYYTFENPPSEFTPKFMRQVTIEVKDGRVVWQGRQGRGRGGIVEYSSTVNADAFIKLEADLEMKHEQAASIGLRISTGAAAASSFELEFGKDEQGRLAYRFKDFSGTQPDWQSVERRNWPESGRMRLGIETENLDSGLFKLYANGEDLGMIQLNIKKPTKLNLGVAVQSQPETDVLAFADNLAILLRSKDDPTGQERGKLIKGGTKDKP